MPRLPRSKYPVPLAHYRRLAGRVAIGKSAWYSLRLRGPVVVGRGSRLVIRRHAEARLARGAILVIGLEHDHPAGASVVLEPHARLSVTGFVQVMRGAQVTVNWHGVLSIGGGTYINDGALVYCGGETSIGCDCAISWNVTITDSDVHVLVRQAERRPSSAPVVIEDRCWLGTGVTVLKGVRIGTGAVVGAASVVTADVPAGALAVGSPARVIDPAVDWAIR